MKKTLWWSVFCMLLMVFGACSDEDNDNQLPLEIKIGQADFTLTALSGTMEVSLEVSDPSVQLEASRFALGGELSFTGSTMEIIPALTFKEIKPGASSNERVLVIGYEVKGDISGTFTLAYPGATVTGTVRMDVSTTGSDVTARFSVADNWLLNYGGTLVLNSEEVDMATVDIEDVELAQPQFADYFTVEAAEGNIVRISAPKPEFAAVNPGTSIDFMVYIHVTYGDDGQKGTIRHKVTVPAMRTLMAEKIINAEDFLVLRDAFEQAGIQHSSPDYETLEMKSDYRFFVVKDGVLMTPQEAGVVLELAAMMSGPDSYWPILKYKFGGEIDGDTYDVILRVKPTADASYGDYGITLYQPVG